MRVRSRSLMALSTTLGWALLQPGCDRAGAGPAPAPAPAPVRTAVAERRDLPLEIRTIGTVESLATVTVRPQIAGRIVEVPLQEGQEVRPGDTLVRIDPRPFEAALAEARARLEAARARERDARLAFAQMEAAAQGRAVSERERDKSGADAEAAAAEVRVAEAIVQTGELQLEYCTITSPIAGRSGLVRVKAGNVVKENETEIAQINQMAPIGVSFAVPEGSLAEVRRLREAGPLSVQAAPPGDDRPAPVGEVTFLDNQVDPATGTIRLRATFANEDRRLWPGQFVRVTLTLAVERGVIVIPSYALQNGQQGPFVFVVKDGTAQMRPVVVARTVGDLSAIRSGLEPGEVVVTEGQLRLVPGVKVDAKADAPAGPRS